MAKLTIDECLDRIKRPRNTDYIRHAIRQEERLVMHCEPIQDTRSIPYAVQEFLLWVKSFLPADKFKRFEQLLTLPLETVDSTETIFDELSKVYDTPDKYTKVEFKNAAYEEEYNEYLSTLKDEEFWQTKGFQALKTGINSFLVCDVKASQTTLRPEPYYYLLSISAVHDVEINEKEGTVEYIAFWQKDDTIIVIDELAYRRFVKPENQDWQIDGEYYHSAYVQRRIDEKNTVYGDLIDGIGYTPVCSFYRHAIKGSGGINKRGPLTSVLSKLDWLLFWRTSKKYLDLYGAWPVVVRYKEDCDYRDENDNHCHEGYINYQQLDPTTNDYKACQKECPVCAKNGLLGAGTEIKVDPPKDREDVDLMLNPVKFIEVSNDKLEYGTKEIVRLEDEIFLNTVGYVNSNPTKEAINEKQVKSQFESRESILNRIREQLDASREFALSTCARIRYGNLFLRATVFGGREFFLQSAEDIALQYSDAKKFGLPMYEVAKIRESYSKTKFKNNPNEYMRSFILSQLEPYPDLTFTEMKTIGIDMADPENFLLKADFYNLIQRFEREQMNIVEFGSLLDLSQKINIIKQKLLEYVREKQPAKVDPSARTVTR